MIDPDVLAGLVIDTITRALIPLQARLATLEARPILTTELREPVTEGALALCHRVEALEARTAVPGQDGQAGKDGRDGIDGRDGQPAAPGAPGRDGAKGDQGDKGADGKDGRDGTLEGATIIDIDERTLAILRPDGSELGRKTFPIPLYRGVYVAGAGYVKGDAVTYGGSLWIARDATKDKPGDGVTAWQLAVKAGRDGKDGKLGERGPIGPKGERGEAGRNYT